MNNTYAEFWKCALQVNPSTYLDRIELDLGEKKIAWIDQGEVCLVYNLVFGSNLTQPISKV